MSYNPRLNFLIQILTAVAKNDTPTNIYPRLEANKHLLDEEFAQVLQSWARGKFTAEEREAAHNIAHNINSFCIRMREFPLGNRANNLDITIIGYEILLTFFTPTAFPEKWAMTQNNLGIAYGQRISGYKAENLELAITCFQAALKVYTRKAFPEKWAQTQNNLGIAYINRILGDRTENLELAIASYKAALQVRTSTAFPEKWAQTQHNLGIAYSNRILGDSAENLELAIASYKAALQVRTSTTFPRKWSETQHNLGIAYKNQISGNRAENLELAINCYKAAMQVRTRAVFPEKWAHTQDNLGIAYTNRILGDRAENLEMAIASHQAALEVYTCKDFPQKWAQAQNNLGVAYSDRILGNKTKNLELAYNAYKSAIDTLDMLRQQNVSNLDPQLKLAEEFNGLYRQVIEVCLQLDDYNQAIEYIERSRKRNLVGLIKKQILQKQLQPLENEIAQERLRLKTSENTDENYLNQLQVKHEEIQRQEITFSHINFHDIQALIDDHTAIVQWYIFDDCFRAFIITSHNQEPKIWSSTSKNLHELEEWKEDYLHIYEPKKSSWRPHLTLKLQRLAEILHIDEILTQFIPPTIQALIIVPHRYLHLFPFHALPVKSKVASEEFLIDKFPNGIRYTPSCQLLQLAKNQKQQISATPFQKVGELGRMFAIQDPNENLHYTNIEVETIARNFKLVTVLDKSRATKEALSQPPHYDNFLSAQWLHFSGHGYFDLESPLNSALALANCSISSFPVDADSKRYHSFSKSGTLDLERCLTLGDIFNLNLSQCRLVTLSACQTGLVDHKDISDEYIGLPSGFLKAGSAVVISTLWSVDDFSTALLMIRFYDNLTSVPIVQALTEAQHWLRHITQEQLIKWTIEHEKIEPSHKNEIQQELSWFNPEEKPFYKPINWAGFCAIGE